MSEHTTTLSLQAIPETGGSTHVRVVSLLRSRLPTALAVALMWALAVVDWLSIYAGNAPNRKIFFAIVTIAAVLAAGRARLALIDKHR